MNPVLLLDTAADLPTPALLRASAAESFGHLAQYDNLAKQLPCARQPKTPDVLNEWRRAVAEELLLATVLGHKLPSSVLRPFFEMRPFDTSSIRLVEALKRHAAVAMIPLDGGDKLPFCAHLWLIEDEWARNGSVPGWESLPARRKIRGRLHAVHIVSSCLNPPQVTGASYELALRLLERAIKENDQKAKHALSQEWIVSGQMNNDQVQRVDLGNKLSLDVPRRWLLPKANKGDTRVAEHDRDADYAEDFNTAWNIVTGHGPRFEGRKNWPDNARVLHSFVSGAREPVVAAALLTRPARVVLWYSGAAWTDTVCNLKKIFAKLLPKTKIETQQISSTNLSEAQRTLAEHPVSMPEELVVFNITQGNRLMSFAAQGVAQRDPNVWLIYRDIDADHFEFTMINYDHSSSPHTHILDGSNRTAGMPRIKNWKRLFTKPTSPGRASQSVQEFIEELTCQNSE